MCLKTTFVENWNYLIKRSRDILNFKGIRYCWKVKPKKLKLRFKILSWILSKFNSQNSKFNSSQIQVFVSWRFYNPPTQDQHPHTFKDTHSHLSTIFKLFLHEIVGKLINKRMELDRQTATGSQQFFKFKRFFLVQSFQSCFNAAFSN